MQPVSSVRRRPRFGIAALAALIAIAMLPFHSAGSQPSVSECRTYRAASTVAGIGLGAALGAVPATIVHRHDQRASHAIMAVSISGGALVGFIGSGRGHPCAAPASNGPRVPDPVFAARESHSWKGALVGAVAGGLLGAYGGSQLNIGCTRDPCDEASQRRLAIAGSAGVGALAGGVLGSLVGWAWPVH